MDSARLQMLQELMKEARATGELESSLAATSVMPVPKRPNRKNVPLADFNLAVANMVKPSASVQPPGIQSSGIQSSGIQAPGIQAVPKSTLMADVPASSNAPPMSQGPMPQMGAPMQTKPVSTAATNPETSQGINRSCWACSSLLCVAVVWGGWVGLLGIQRLEARLAFSTLCIFSCIVSCTLSWFISDLICTGICSDMSRHPVIDLVFYRSCIHTCLCWNWTFGISIDLTFRPKMGSAKKIWEVWGAHSVHPTRWTRPWIAESYEVWTFSAWYQFADWKICCFSWSFKFHWHAVESFQGGSSDFIFSWYFQSLQAFICFVNCVFRFHWDITWCDWVTWAVVDIRLGSSKSAASDSFGRSGFRWNRRSTARWLMQTMCRGLMQFLISFRLSWGDILSMQGNWKHVLMMICPVRNLSLQVSQTWILKTLPTSWVPYLSGSRTLNGHSNVHVQALCKQCWVVFLFLLLIPADCRVSISRSRRQVRWFFWRGMPRGVTSFTKASLQTSAVRGSTGNGRSLHCCWGIASKKLGCLLFSKLHCLMILMKLGCGYLQQGVPIHWRQGIKRGSHSEIGLNNIGGVSIRWGPKMLSIICSLGWTKAVVRLSLNLCLVQFISSSRLARFQRLTESRRIRFGTPLSSPGLPRSQRRLNPRKWLRCTLLPCVSHWSVWWMTLATLCTQGRWHGLSSSCFGVRWDVMTSRRSIRVAFSSQVWGCVCTWVGPRPRGRTNLRRRFRLLCIGRLHWLVLTGLVWAMPCGLLNHFLIDEIIWWWKPLPIGAEYVESSSHLQVLRRTSSSFLGCWARQGSVQVRGPWSTPPFCYLIRWKTSFLAILLGTGWHLLLQ